MRKILFTLLLLTASIVSFAGGAEKTNSITGKVIDDEGNPVIGAKVLLMDSQKEVYTDFDGVFHFEEVNGQTSTLKVSFLSHKDLIAEIPAANSSSLQLEIESK